MKNNEVRATVNDAFWSPLRETVRLEGIPYQWHALHDDVPGAEPSYCIKNFRVAAGREKGGHGGTVFQDSDIAKWLEGAAYSLMWHPDTQLEHMADEAIDDIVAAQQPDGYLDTYYIITGLARRWTNLMDHHELYCAGHMLEAALAYEQATNKRKLLDAMLKYVDLIDSTFGTETGKKLGYPGHPVLEMALMRLYARTGDPRHLALARYMIEQRGQPPLYFAEERCREKNQYVWDGSPFGDQYYQAGKPLREQTEAEGHAVRAMYLYCGMTDVARETNDKALKEVCRRLWRNVTERRMYITGAVGSSAYGESFTFDYDLPNDTVYGETCASIGLVFWAYRMMKMEPRREYADVMELALYNSVISGMQLDGKRFFYVNPLEVIPEACIKDHGRQHVKPERQKWFTCACCPPNLIRMLASLENYLYTADDNDWYVHLYVASIAQASFGGVKASLEMRTSYPWQENISISVKPDQPVHFRLALRIPQWCESEDIRLNQEVYQAVIQNGYAYIDRIWQPNDVVDLRLPMHVEVLHANPRVREDAGKVCVRRGPIVYCLEEADNGNNLHLIRLNRCRDFQTRFEPETLGGVVTLTSNGIRETLDGWDEHRLYAPRDESRTQSVRLHWIPYYAWANRTTGEMCVWVRD
jgi:uncharacterized protein